MKNDSFVSVVLILQDQSLINYESYLQRIQCDLDAHYTDYEVVVVSQGFNVTFTSLEDNILKSIPSLRYIQLAARVDSDVAWAAGLENAIGDFVVMFDPFQDPLEAISETVTLCKSGFDVVVGVSPQSRTLAYWLFRSMSERILKIVDYSLPRNATSFRCLSRRAVNSVTRTGRFHHQLSMRIQKTGYPQTAYDYKQLASSRKVTRSFLSGFRDLIRLIVFNSSKPLRWMSFIGLLGSFSAFIFAAYSLLVHLVKGHVVEGWTTTILFMSSLFMMQFVMMAFFGEYLGRLLDDRSDQSDYSVMFEKNSTVMVNQDRVNVFDSSLSTEENRVQTGRDR